MDRENMYIRQSILPEIGQAGQEKLSQAKVAIIGCGGLGSPAAVYLAASGIGQLHLIDYDQVDLSNLHRQVFYKPKHLGMSKAKILAAYIKDINPFIEISYEEKPLTKDAIFKQLKGFPLIVDCTDSLATKYLLNDFCVLNEKVLVYGSLYKHDGYVGVFNVKTAESYSAHLRDAFPQMPSKHVPNCAEIGTLNPIVGIIGLMQANEVIKNITGTGKPLINQILIYNAMENTQFTMGIKPGFPLEKVKAIYDKETYFEAKCLPQDPSLLINAIELRNRLPDAQLKIVSVFEDATQAFPFPVDLHMPLSALDPTKLSAFQGDEIVVVCQKGISSYEAVLQIKKVLPEMTVFSLKDGLSQF